MTNSSAEPKAYGTSRLVCLDGLRGVAAFCVAVFHQNHTLLPGGNLAVDFFFVLSGFVLQRSYEPRFATGLTADRFARLRVARLAPLFWVGLLLGVVNVVQGVLRHSALICRPGKCFWRCRSTWPCFRHRCLSNCFH